MKNAVGFNNVKVVLKNTVTGQDKVITLLDDHHIVAMAVVYFARTEGISLRQVDIQIAPEQSHA